MITIPIDIGDVILTGKFKNHKITVQEIGLDDYGLPTVNGKGIMKIRIEKLIPKPKTIVKEWKNSKFIGIERNPKSIDMDTFLKMIDNKTKETDNSSDCIYMHNGPVNGVEVEMSIEGSKSNMFLKKMITPHLFAVDGEKVQLSKKEYTLKEFKDLAKYYINLKVKLRGESILKNLGNSTMKNIQEGPATNDPKIQRLVDGINKVIASAIDSDGDPIPVVDNSSTWEEPVIYEPIIYKNGILKITYEQSMGGAGKSVDFIKKSNMEFDGIPTLKNILKMYNKAIKQNKNAKPSVGESTIKETPVNNADRILKMVTSWKKEGRAFSNVKNNDNAFFKAIKISPMKVGMTSQTGNDIIYYNTEMFDNDSDAVRNRKKSNVGESSIKENTNPTVIKGLNHYIQLYASSNKNLFAELGRNILKAYEDGRKLEDLIKAVETDRGRPGTKAGYDDYLKVLKSGLTESTTIKENSTDKIQVVVDKHRSTPHEKLHVNKDEAEKYFAIQKQTGLIKVTSIGYDKYAIELTQKGLDKFGLKESKKINHKDVVIKEDKGKFFVHSKIDNTPVINKYGYNTQQHATASAIFKGYNVVSESKKNSKMKLSEVISKGIFVTIKKEDGKFWFYIDNNGEQECISNVGFPTKEAAEHAALTKGFNVEKGGDAEDELPKTVEVPKPKAREKTPDTEKPKEIDLGKEKEIKLEEQIKKIIREEIKNFRSSYQKKKP